MCVSSVLGRGVRVATSTAHTLEPASLIIVCQDKEVFLFLPLLDMSSIHAGDHDFAWGSELNSALELDGSDDDVAGLGDDGDVHEDKGDESSVAQWPARG